MPKPGSGWSARAASPTFCRARALHSGSRVGHVLRVKRVNEGVWLLVERGSDLGELDGVRPLDGGPFERGGVPAWSALPVERKVVVGRLGHLLGQVADEPEVGAAADPFEGSRGRTGRIGTRFDGCGGSSGR